MLRLICLVLFAAVLPLEVRAAVNAPLRLPTCIIEYGRSGSIGWGLRVVLYDSSSGTFTELADTYHSATISTPVNLSEGQVTDVGVDSPTSSSSPVHKGAFTYSVDPADPAHAIILQDFGGSNPVRDDLYFYTNRTGDRNPEHHVVALEATWFRLSPKQTSNGGINFSQRCTLTPGGNAISGFVIDSDAPRWVLIRGVGASLRGYGVSPVVKSPAFEVFNGKQESVGRSTPWSLDPNLVSGFQTAFSLTGAFPLTDGSDDAVLLVALAPGSYTAVFKADSPGQILCEAYLLPF